MIRMTLLEKLIAAVEQHKADVTAAFEKASRRPGGIRIHPRYIANVMLPSPKKRKVL